MNLDFVAEIPLVCPACRTVDEDGCHLHTLDVQSPHSLICSGCGREYPVVDGIPLVLAEADRFLADSALAIAEGDVPAAVTAALALAGGDSDAWPVHHEYVSTWALAHWGDAADPPVPGGYGFDGLASRLRERSQAPVDRAIELGCGFGRGLAELARGAGLVVGVDLAVAALRRARRLLAGEPLMLSMRTVGRHSVPVTLRPSAPVRNAVLIGADALDPPVPPNWWDRVVALNVLDNVHHPLRLLQVMDGLCVPGGELIIASPYAWKSGVVDEDRRLGGADPSGALTEMLRSGADLGACYAIEEEAVIPWTLRKDARCRIMYDVHWVRARKLEG